MPFPPSPPRRKDLSVVDHLGFKVGTKVPLGTVFNLAEEEIYKTAYDSVVVKLASGTGSAFYQMTLEELDGTNDYKVHI